MSMTMSVSELAQVLFASAVQRSDDPTPEQVRAVVAECSDCRECAACVAQEAGDHPEEYAARMRWALHTVVTAFPEFVIPGQVDGKSKGAAV